MLKRILYFFLLIPFIYSCEKGIFDSGDTIKKEIILKESFKQIIINNLFEITLVQDTVNKAIVYCGENLMPDVSVAISENILYINHSIVLNWTRNYEKVKMDLHLISVPSIQLKKPCSITTKDTFRTENFIVTVWESRCAIINACIDANFCGIYMSSDDFGTYKIKGKSTYTDFQPWGSGFIDCRDLLTEHCTIHQRSIADIYVNVSKKLVAEIQAKGNVCCYGNPESIELKNNPTQGKLITY